MEVPFPPGHLVDPARIHIASEQGREALFHSWRVTGGERIPGMVTRWCDFLDRKAFTPDGSKVRLCGRLLRVRSPG